MRHLLAGLIAAVPALLSSPLPATDRVVDPNNPLAYPTLQAALNAALPGDRILLAVSVFTDRIVVQKSVTIEPLGSGRQSIALVPGFPASGEFRIDALTPGIPLTIRRIDFGLLEMSGAPRGIRTAGAVPGEIRFDQVQVQYSGGSGYSIWGGGSMVDLDTTVVWMRETTMTAYDMYSNNGCIDLDGTYGTNGLVVRADTLHLEDCTLRASSANHLFYHCCFGSTPNCIGQWATGGNGGAALRATTRNSTLVRCALSDGNGGTVEAGPWLVPAAGGAAGLSVLGGQTGTLDPFAVSWEQGLPGHIGNALAGRGAITVWGPAAPLSIGGPVTPGTYLDVTLATPGLSVFLVGFAWGQTPSAGGTYWVDPVLVFAHGGGGTTQTYALPNAPGLRGLPIVLQAVQVFPMLRLGNPSGVAIR